jgi:RNA polymerase sigma-B factor
MKVPRRLQELSVAVNRAVDTLTSDHQRSPTIPEIAEHVGVSAEDVLLAMEASSAYNLLPLDTGHGNDDSDSFSLVDLALLVEDDFGVRIEDTELNAETFDTLNQLARLIAQRKEKS